MEHSTVSIIALGPMYRVHTVPLELSYIVLCRRFPCGVHINIRADVRHNQYIERCRLLDQTTDLPFLWGECQPKYCSCSEEGKRQVFTLQREGALFSHHREGALSPGPRTGAAVSNHCREGALSTHHIRGLSPHTTQGVLPSIAERGGALSTHHTEEDLSKHCRGGACFPNIAERARALHTPQRGRSFPNIAERACSLHTSHRRHFLYMQHSSICTHHREGALSS